MRARLGMLMFVVACGSTPAPQPTIANRPATAAPTCADVGVILRGEVDAENPDKAGPAREAAISNACEMDRWKPEVIACVTSAPRPATCLDKLTAKQREAYRSKLEAWAEQWGGATYGGAMYGGEGYGGDDVAYVDCGDVVGDAARYSPAVDAKDAAREWKVRLRQASVLEACQNPGWAETTKKCVGGAADTAGLDACLQAETTRGELAGKLSAIDTLAAKIAAAKKKPAAFTCARLVAEHYADAKWKDKLTSLKAPDRKQAIKESRDRMTKACTADKWDDTLRACLSVGGDAQCYAGAGKPDAFGYPAAGVLVAGVPGSCLDYKAAIDRMQLCDKMPKESREAIKNAFDQAAAAWVNLPPEAQAALADACKAGSDAIVQAGKSVCGW